MLKGTNRLFITLSFSLIFTAGYNQLSIKGSFFIIAKGSDGIMIATESRGNFFNINDPYHQPLAYYDSVQKSFIIGNNVIAFTGTGAFGDWFTRAIIDRYKQEMGDSIPATFLLNSYILFCKKVMDKTLYDQLLKNLFASAGFQNGKAYLSYYQPQTGVRFSDTINYIESDVTSFAKLYNRNFTCKKLGEIAATAIYNYAKNRKMTNVIGGPVRVIRLNEKGGVWIKNKPSFSYYKIQEVVELHAKGKIKFTYTAPENKIVLDSMLLNYRTKQ